MATGTARGWGGAARLIVAGLLTAALATPGTVPRVLAGPDDDNLGAWCRRAGLRPLDPPEAIRTGVSFKARIVSRDGYKQRFKAEDVRQGDVVVVTLVGVLPGNRGLLEMVNLRTGNSILVKF
ncbi:MAG: hypothetical protein KKC37_09840 [Proteobacteria bacterium]|nr:hypothetical protein [Pseudomonadota bacterium]